MIQRDHTIGLSRILILSVLTFGVATGAPTGNTDSFRTIVESDWSRQEKRRKRAPGDPVAILEALDRGEALLEDLARGARPPDLGRATAALADLRKQVENLSALDKVELLNPEVMETIEGVLQNRPELPTQF